MYLIYNTKQIHQLFNKSEDIFFGLCLRPKRVHDKYSSYMKPCKLIKETQVVDN